MKLKFEIPDEALLDFGKAAIEQEVQDSLKWLQLRRNFVSITQTLQNAWQPRAHRQIVEELRADAWQEYKQDLGL